MPGRSPPPIYPAFVPRAPWWGADLQTLRNFLLPRPSALARFPETRLQLAMTDGSGDRLVALLNRPADPAPPRPLVVLIHGLTGCADSDYARASARHLLGLGYPVLRLNLRGAGPSRPLCRYQYHAGRSQDLRDALAAVPAALRARGVLALGYSLGANILMKYLAEAGSSGGVRAAATVSAPLDLAATSRHMLKPRNAIYHRYLLGRMKRESLAPASALSRAERRAVLDSRTIVQFDQDFTAPRNGFEGAADYYARVSGRRFLPAIEVPLLVIHAADDPWIPSRLYRAFDWSCNPRLCLLLAPGGGHVGFHGRDHGVPWHDRCVAAFFEQAD